MRTTLKRTAAFLLITLLSFNLFGYLLVVRYLQKRASDQLEITLDRNGYDEAGSVELKIPMANPYFTGNADYHRYDGQIEISGIHYKFVKRRVDNDTLYVICIPDNPKMHFKKIRDNYFAQANDLTHNQPNAAGKSKIGGKVLSGDYDTHSGFAMQIASGRYRIKTFAEYTSSDLMSSPGISPEQPPDQLS